MNQIFIQMSKYIFAILSIFFLYSCIRCYFNTIKNKDKENTKFYKSQKITILLMHFVGYLILIFENYYLDILILYIEEVIFFLLVWIVINYFYKDTNKLIWNIVLYFLFISFVILTRINYATGLRHFRIVLFGFVIAFILIILIDKLNFLKKLTWAYILISYILLLAVNSTINGAQNWLYIGNFSFQPSELVKLFYVFFLASFFDKGITFKKLIISSILTGGLVIMLVLQRDLGGALIFFFVYVVILYIITNQERYFYIGLALGSLGAFIGYKFFSHVKVRVEAWMNPWINIDSNGYQIAQSLFAIGAGRWFGTGLTNGYPNKIPVASSDLIFSVISEEFGNLFSLSLIGIFLILFLISTHIAYKCKDYFTQLLTIGFSIIFAFQSFLIIGGVTKLIPITGVTLPFISYGGTSLIVCCSIIGVIQGINMKIKRKSIKGDNYEK